MFEIGDRVRVASLRNGEGMPEDVVGSTGVVSYVTSGFAGERGFVEVTLDDGRVAQFQVKELEPA